MLNKIEEFNHFIEIINKNIEDLKKTEKNILKEKVFFIANKIRTLFLKQKYTDLYAPTIKGSLLDIKLDYYFNNILIIKISRGSLEKTFKIDFKKETYLSEGIIESQEYSIFTKKTTFDFFSTILIKKGNLTLIDAITKEAVKINQKFDLVDEIYNLLSLNIDIDELILTKIITKDNSINYIYEYSYKDQLVIPNENKTYIFGENFKI